MIADKYYQGLFKMIPVSTAMDFCECALEHALILLDFKLIDDVKYTLIVGRNSLPDILKLNCGYNIFNITVELQEEDGWYLVNETSKTIVYSPGI